MSKLCKHVGFLKGESENDSTTSTCSLSSDGSNIEFIPPPSHPNSSPSLGSVSRSASRSIITPCAHARTKVVAYKPSTSSSMATQS
jgi:hypothetical protein